MSSDYSHRTPNLSNNIFSELQPPIYVENVRDEIRLYYQKRPRTLKQREATRKNLRLFEAKLKKMSDGLTRPRTKKQPEFIAKKILAFQNQYRGLGHHYEISMKVDDITDQVQSITWNCPRELKSLMQLPGMYFFRINDTESNEKVWRNYLKLCKREQPLSESTGLEHSSVVHQFSTLIADPIALTVISCLKIKGWITAGNHWSGHFVPLQKDH